MARIVARAVAAAMVLLAAGSAWGGQDDEEWRLDRSLDVHKAYSMRIPPAPLFADAELRRWVETLGLDARQRDALMGSVASSDQAYRERWLEVDVEMERRRRAKEYTGDTKWEMAGALASAYESGRASVVEDLGLVLTGAQRERWPAFERDRRRRELLGDPPILPSYRYWGSRYTSGLDLAEVPTILALGADEVEGVAPIIEEYVVEIDTELRRLEGAMERVEARALALVEPTRLEGEAAQERWAERSRELVEATLGAWDAAERVREVTGRYAEEVASELPAPRADRLRDLLSRSARPRSSTRGQRLLRTVESMAAGSALDTIWYARWSDRMSSVFGRAERRAGGLRPDQAERVEALGEAYAEDLLGLRARYRRFESGGDRGPSTLSVQTRTTEFMIQRSSRREKRKDDPNAEAYGEALRELDERLQEDLEAILDTDQRIFVRALTW
jgi:hypothetical protein